ncbi:unnamed protein product [Fraxinus pennsylvanica]|uniref:Low-density receptor-like protein n=1 Tax=Fraxinus pennsylvanica TaxID=56036 RepID=A0AAD2EEU7_9LAMI|nr:unnamed protein product [Fraxinus pennsylvanica]
MAAGIPTFSLSGGNALKSRDMLFVKSGTFVNTPPVIIQAKKSRSGTRRNLSVRAESGDHRGGSGDFVTGFLIGGAIFGTVAYVFAPQIRRSLLNEDEYGFRRARQPIYYDEGLEKTRQTLNEKIGQLNSAIDNVSSRLRGGKNIPEEPIETDVEEAAA